MSSITAQLREVYSEIERAKERKKAKAYVSTYKYNDKSDCVFLQFWLDKANTSAVYYDINGENNEFKVWFEQERCKRYFDKIAPTLSIDWDLEARRKEYAEVVEVRLPVERGCEPFHWLEKHNIQATCLKHEVRSIELNESVIEFGFDDTRKAFMFKIVFGG